MTGTPSRRRPVTAPVASRSNTHARPSSRNAVAAPVGPTSTCVSWAAGGPVVFAGPTVTVAPAVAVGGGAAKAARAPIASARLAALAVAPASRRAAATSTASGPFETSIAVVAATPLTPPSRSTCARRASLRATARETAALASPYATTAVQPSPGGERTSLPQSCAGPALPGSSGAITMAAPPPFAVRAAASPPTTIASRPSRSAGRRSRRGRTEAMCASDPPASSASTPRSTSRALRGPVSASASAASIRRVGASGMRSSSAIAACARTRATAGPTAACGDSNVAFRAR